MHVLLGFLTTEKMSSRQSADYQRRLGSFNSYGLSERSRDLFFTLYLVDDGFVLVGDDLVRCNFCNTVRDLRNVDSLDSLRQQHDRWYCPHVSSQRYHEARLVAPHSRVEEFQELYSLESDDVQSASSSAGSRLETDRTMLVGAVGGYDHNPDRHIVEHLENLYAAYEDLPYPVQVEDDADEEGNDERDECTICCSRRCDTLILQCRHEICANCSRCLTTKSCPYCRGYIDGFVPF